MPVPGNLSSDNKSSWKELFGEVMHAEDKKKQTAIELTSAKAELRTCPPSRRRMVEGKKYIAEARFSEASTMCYCLTNTYNRAVGECEREGRSD